MKSAEGRGAIDPGSAANYPGSTAHAYSVTADSSFAASAAPATPFSAGAPSTTAADVKPTIPAAAAPFTVQNVIPADTNAPAIFTTPSPSAAAVTASPVPAAVVPTEAALENQASRLRT